MRYRVGVCREKEGDDEQYSAVRNIAELLGPFMGPRDRSTVLPGTSATNQVVSRDHQIYIATRKSDYKSILYGQPLSEKSSGVQEFMLTETVNLALVQFALLI